MDAVWVVKGTHPKKEHGPHRDIFFTEAQAKLLADHWDSRGLEAEVVKMIPESDAARAAGGEA